MDQTVLLDGFDNKRKTSYILISAIIGILFIVTRNFSWQGNFELHIVMEVMATVLAFVVGFMALVHHYSKKDEMTLFISVGFICAAIFDGMHAWINTAYFNSSAFGVEYNIVDPWLWQTSRMLLAALLFVSWLSWRQENEKEKIEKIKESHIFISILAFATFIYTYLLFYPQGQVEFFSIVIGNPQELYPAAIFALALVGYFRKGVWKTDYFEHWIIMALIANTAGQFLFMPLSVGVNDLAFGIGHLLKFASYLFVLIGLNVNMYTTFRQAEFDSIRLMKANKNLRDTILKRKGVENIARYNENKLRAIFEAVSDGIITTDQSGIILVFNAGAEEMFGYKAEEVIGKNVKILMPERFAKHHDDHIKQYTPGKGISAIGKRHDLEGLRKDGTTFLMDLTVNESSGKDQMRIITGIVRDITDEKRAANKIEQSAQDLAKSNEELEQFAYVASHDLKAPLRGIDNLAGFIKEDLGEDIDEDIAKNFNLLQNRIFRMEKLLDDLLEYSRVGRKSNSLEKIDLADLFENTITLINPPEGFNVNVSGKLGQINTIHTPLQQILMNIIGNAIKHHDKDHGNISINVSENEDFVHFKITDDGPGIPEQFHERIFKMFQTLKPRDEVEGSGMGLAIVKKVIENVGGTIEIKSKDGERGTRFFISWPKNIERSEEGNE